MLSALIMFIDHQRDPKHNIKCSGRDFWYGNKRKNTYKHRPNSASLSRYNVYNLEPTIDPFQCKIKQKVCEKSLM